MKPHGDSVGLSGNASLTHAGDRLAAHMAAAWARGEHLPAEHYLDRHPKLLELPEEAVRVIYEEICLRQERGEEVCATELEHRFPQWTSELAVMLECHRLVEERLATPQFPAVGEALGDFRLLAELGRGRNGRVYLAVQPLLADRPVVLKVTPRQDCEFLSLARLQHTNIIPLYGVHDFPTRNLRALCQPYFGGATLARLLDGMRSVRADLRTGRSLVDALDDADSRGKSPLPRPAGGPREVFVNAAYADVICWIGICLAEALHYAHERGLVHLDLKPANILVASDGQPLLLDFHLSLHPLAAGAAVPAGMGGTLGYMSPEQRAAYLAGRHEQPAPEKVDRRSDVYSLGRLLYAALADEVAGDALPRLNRRNPKVSVGLADIIHRCLAVDPANRYANAALLAADLRLHLADLPLSGAPNRSLSERWRKWRRRRTASVLGAGLLLALAVAGLALGTTALERLHDAREALREGQTQIQQGRSADAIRTLSRGKAWAQSLPGCQDLVDGIDEQLRQAHRANTAQQLHALTERLRLLAGSDDLSEHELKTADAHCRTVWEMRGLFASHPSRESEEEHVRADLIDLALLWTDLKQRLAPGDQAIKAESRRVLAEARSLCGPSRALEWALSALDGAANPAVGRSAQSFHDHAALGRVLLREGSLDRAAEELERAVDLRPNDFWSHYYSGVCAFRRGRHAEAISSFNVAVALAPEFPEVYYNRALAHTAAGNTASALRDYDRALTLAPALASAALNRGILHHQQGRDAQAIADLKQALQCGVDPTAANYNLALVYLATGELAAALQSVECALRSTPTHLQAKLLRAKLQGQD